MRMAMLSRGHNPRWIWQLKAYTASAGALFIRSYERGERVYYAMTARGFTGRVPTFDGKVRPADWARALSVPAIAWLAAGWGVVAR